MKRILFALGVGLAMFAVVAFAATLIVNSGGLQSGEDEVVCDNAVNVFYQDTDANGDYDRASVTDVDCPGTKDVTVEVQTGGHFQLAYGTVSTNATGTVLVPLSNVLSPPSEILNADHVHVTIVSTGP